MRNTLAGSFTLLVVFAVLATTVGAGPSFAQADPEPEDAEATEAAAGEVEDAYTNDSLQDPGPGSQAAVTNRTLEDSYAGPATPPGAFTNEDLRKLFGEGAAPGTEPAAMQEGGTAGAPVPETVAPDAAAPRPGTAAPPQSPSERAARIAQIEALIAALEEELEALRRLDENEGGE